MRRKPPALNQRILALVVLAWTIGVSPLCAQPLLSSRCSDRPVPSVGGVITGTVGSLERLPSGYTAAWLLAGGGAALATHPADTEVTRHFANSERLGDLLGPGAAIGSAAAQLGAAVGTYAIGRIANQSCVGAVGADLLRAQLVAEALTLTMQYSIRRTRPDGSSFSFPSGHASVAFASAAVLQQQFGWKTGLVAYAAASYVAASRLQANRHFLSDVVFGAAVGMVSAHAATLGEKHRLAAIPSIAPVAGGIQFVWIR